MIFFPNPMFGSGASGGGGYSGTVIPPTITSLEAWYNASILTGANNDSKSTWADSSGNGFTATEVTVGFGAQLKTANINGLNTLQFDGNRKYSIATTILNGATAASWAAVFVNDNEPRSGGDFGALIDGIGSSGSDTHHPYTDQTIYDGFATTARKTVGDPTPSLSSPRIAVVRSAASDFTWHLDGTLLFSTATNTVGIQGSGVGVRRIGANKSDTGDNCRIAELCVFRAALTTLERQKMEGYLAWKWGLQANLPGGHPYLSAPP